MTLGQWLDAAERELTQTGSPDPRTDAEWMAVDVLGVSRSMLKMMLKNAISDQQQIQLDSLLSRHALNILQRLALGSALKGIREGG